VGTEELQKAKALENEGKEAEDKVESKKDK
jgi:hypothetical protein